MLETSQSARHVCFPRRVSRWTLRAPAQELASDGCEVHVALQGLQISRLAGPSSQQRHEGFASGFSFKLNGAEHHPEVRVSQVSPTVLPSLCGSWHWSSSVFGAPIWIFSCCVFATITQLFHGWAETSSIKEASAGDLNTEERAEVAKDNGELEVTSCHTVNLSLWLRHVARLKWSPHHVGSLGWNIFRKETRKPSDKHITNPARNRNIPFKRTKNAAATKSCTTGTVDKSNCCCRDKVPPAV